MDSCESQNTCDLNEGDDNNESEGEYDEDPIMECNQVDEATDVDVVFQEGDDGEIIRVGPKKSTVKRVWKQCSAVDYDPSTQGDRRFKGVSHINWNGTELQTPVQNRTPITYFKKACISY